MPPKTTAIAFLVPFVVQSIGAIPVQQGVCPLWIEVLISSAVCGATLMKLISRRRDHDHREYQRGEAVRLSELTATNDQLREIAAIDGLTEIPNRRHFDAVFAHEWERCRRDQNWVALLMCDVDCFKAYNDHYGHLDGDRCLRQVARTLAQSAARASDLVARYGGEEFVILLPNTDLKGACKIAETAVQSMRDLNLHHQFSAAANSVSISIGVAAIIPGPDDSGESLLHAADQALYAAKTSGRDRWSTVQDFSIS